MKFGFSIWACIFILGACTQVADIPHADILVLGHTYKWGGEGDRIDPQLEGVDYDAYSQVWLLGDICSATTREEETLQYLDDIFSLQANRTKWAVGNHDIRDGNIEYIEQATGRPLYYGDIADSVAIYVLNTQMQHEIYKDSCDYKERQHQEFLSFLDSVSASESLHSLFVLSHNTIWSDAEEALRQYELIGNAQAGWIDMICQWDGEFRNQYLNKLIDIQKQGIQVYCIAGDGGQYRKTFFVKAESGIEYYVSGINNSFLGGSDDPSLKERFDSRPDSVLLFKYDSYQGRFNPKFIPLNNLK